MNGYYLMYHSITVFRFVYFLSCVPLGLISVCVSTNKNKKFINFVKNKE